MLISGSASSTSSLLNLNKFPCRREVADVHSRPAWPTSYSMPSRYPLGQYFGRALSTSRSASTSAITSFAAHSRHQRFCFQIKVFVEHGGNRLVQRMCRNRIREKTLRSSIEELSVRIDQMAALIVGNHIQLFISQTVLRKHFLTPGEFAPAKSLHYKTLIYRAHVLGHEYQAATRQTEVVGFVCYGKVT